MTFMVSADGRTFEKDVGAGTGELARVVAAFDPGKGWGDFGSGQ